jgi:hypothetical protein
MGSVNSHSRNAQLYPSASVRYDLSKPKMVLRKSKKVKKTKKVRNYNYASEFKTNTLASKSIMKISSDVKLVDGISEVHRSLNSSNHSNEITRAGKLPPTLCIAQVKKPFCGNKTNVINEYTTCKKFIFDSKRSSLTNVQPKTTKNSHRAMFLTPSALSRDNKHKKNINFIQPKKKGLLTGTSSSYKNLEGAKKFSKTNYNPDMKSEMKFKLPNSNKCSQSRNVIK